MLFNPYQMQEYKRIRVAVKQNNVLIIVEDNGVDKPDGYKQNFST
jgi:hypothetical protein